MQHALALARKGLGQTYPNPAVGCVIVKQGKVTPGNRLVMPMSTAADAFGIKLDACRSLVKGIIQKQENPMQKCLPCVLQVTPHAAHLM